MPDTTLRLANGGIDLETKELRGPSGTVALTPRQAAFLEFLGSRPGEIVVADEIRTAVWPDQQHLSAGSLHQVAFESRKAMAEAGLDATALVTVARKGYRLDLADKPSPAAPVKEATAQGLSARRKSTALAVALILLMVAASFAFERWKLRQKVAELCRDGFALMTKGSESRLARANELFRDALALDPGSALALAGLAEASARFGGPVPKVLVSGSEISTFQQLAREAVRRDPDCGRCVAVLGFIVGNRDFRIREAVPLLEHAVSLEPRAWLYRVWLAQYQAALGKLPEALEGADAAMRLAPLETSAIASKVSILYFLGRYDEALRLADANIATDPQSQATYHWRSRTHLVRREYPQYFVDRGAEMAIWSGWTPEVRDEHVHRNTSLPPKAALEFVLADTASLRVSTMNGPCGAWCWGTGTEPSPNWKKPQPAVRILSFTSRWTPSSRPSAPSPAFWPSCGSWDWNRPGE